MSENKMLIDASHLEETRVVVVRDKRVDEFDFESAGLRQLRGNIYLAKVTRVEPSLQAAFVDYGGNRNGFLAFNEIHPDYYQIPVADKMALLQEEADDAEDEVSEDVGEEAPLDDNDDADTEAETPAEEDQNEADDELEEYQVTEAGAGVGEPDEGEPETEQASDGENGDALEEVPVRRKKRQRRYKIQEVIKRRQVILIQVVKEERGNKGAALTTYLSLAGRYCVLMPNTAHGGGISRKINNPTDRKRLKDVAQNLEIPDGMGLIVRTAGAKRTKAEVKRDYDYLLRMWEDIRTKTLESSAPNLIYEEGNLIKRSIRDLYGKDMDGIIVEGEEGYKEAREFMKKLMPSHAKNIKAYKEKRPLFIEHEVEQQLDAMYSEKVKLRSGGYLVINQTEALVAIDINSGKSTREHHIEDTALNTNLEAADEISRQLRLRDLAGLIVIDFIDMEERRNNRQVERRLKDSLKDDRARIQVGRISSFGLLEMSRQRMRPGVLEGSTNICPTCHGRGFVRTTDSAALQILRAIETYAMAHEGEDISVRAPSDVVLYILNQKREDVHSIETRYDIKIFVNGDESLLSSQYALASPDKIGNASITDIFGMSETDENGPAKPRRRRRGGGGARRKKNTQSAENNGQHSASENEGESADTEKEDKPESKRRRGRRGGRRRRGRNSEQNTENTASAENTENTEESVTEAVVATSDLSVSSEEEKPKRSRRGRGRGPRAKKADDAGSEDAVVSEVSEAPVTENTEEKPKRRGRKKKVSEEDTPKKEKVEKAEEAEKPKKEKAEKPKKESKRKKPKEKEESVSEKPANPRKGWWQTG